MKKGTPSFRRRKDKEKKAKRGSKLNLLKKASKSDLEKRKTQGESREPQVECEEKAPSSVEYGTMVSRSGVVDTGLGSTAVFDAIKDADQPGLAQCVATFGASAVNALNAHQQTPLHVCAEDGHAHLISFLLAKGADPDAQDKSGWTPLFNAGLRGRTEVCRRLLQARPDCSICSSDRANALHYFVRGDHKDADVAARMVSQMVRLRADVNLANINEETPLMHACKAGNAHMALCLLSCDAEPNALNRFGDSALHLALRLDDARARESVASALARHNVDCTIGSPTSALDIIRGNPDLSRLESIINEAKSPAPNAHQHVDAGPPSRVLKAMPKADKSFSEAGMKSFSTNRMREALSELRGGSDHSSDGGIPLHSTYGGLAELKAMTRSEALISAAMSTGDAPSSPVSSLGAREPSPPPPSHAPKDAAQREDGDRLRPETAAADVEQAKDAQHPPATAAAAEKSDAEPSALAAAESDAPSVWEFKGDFEYDDLQFEDEVGFGSFGAVYKAKYFGTPVAVKELFHSEVEQIQRLIVREVQTLKALRHPNIVNYMGLCVHESGLYLITEFVAEGDLRKYLKNREENPCIPWERRTQIALNVCSAIAFIHAKGLIHRDLKSKNILLDAGRAKICDFGFARDAGGASGGGASMMTTKVGTVQWMAPEVAMGGDYDGRADMFSFGLVLFELLTREKPKPRDPSEGFAFEEEAFVKTIKEMATDEENGPAPEYLVELTRRCVKTNPEERPSAVEALETLDIF